MSTICHFSENSRGDNNEHVILTTEADSLPTDAKAVARGLWLGGMPLKQTQ